MTNVESLSLARARKRFMQIMQKFVETDDDILSDHKLVTIVFQRYDIARMWAETENSS